MSLYNCTTCDNLRKEGIPHVCIELGKQYLLVTTGTLIVPRYFGFDLNQYKVVLCVEPGSKRWWSIPAKAFWEFVDQV